MFKPVKCLVLTLVAAFCLASSASAGDIVLTGHDDDFHGDPQAVAQIKAMAAFARNGSSLPVLVFDHGTELTGRLTTLGIPFTRVDPDAGVSPSLFDPAAFSAMAVASDQSCGGCDNTTTSSANLSTPAVKAAIASFVNAGRGVFAFAGASNAGYYNFLPNTAAPFGFPPSSPYFQTADGLAAGIPAVNGDPTHNFFDLTKSDPAFLAFERLNDPVTGTVETIGVTGATISVSGFVGVPEPGTLTLAGLALLGALGYRLRRRKADAA